MKKKKISRILASLLLIGLVAITSFTIVKAYNDSAYLKTKTFYIYDLGQNTDIGIKVVNDFSQDIKYYWGDYIPNCGSIDIDIYQQGDGFKTAKVTMSAANVTEWTPYLEINTSQQGYTPEGWEDTEFGGHGIAGAGSSVEEVHNLDNNWSNGYCLFYIGAGFSVNYTHALWSSSSHYINVGWDSGVSSVSGANQWYNANTRATLTASFNSGYKFDYMEDLDTGAKYYANPDTWGMGSNRNVYVHSKKNTYTNTIMHWMWGFTNGEGNNENKHAFHIEDITFNADYDSTYTMDSSRGVSVPNGFSLRQSFGTDSISGSWTVYNFGTSVIQKENNMFYEYDYDPITYSITYNMNGGTNNSSNPSSYNVLYGVTLNNPTRTGYTFTGWKDANGNIVTGINEGANATFTSTDDMYNKLGNRTTGNQTLTAQWVHNDIFVNYYANGGTGNNYFTSYDATMYGTNKYKDNVFSRTGYTFKGYSENIDGGVQHNPGDTIQALSGQTRIRNGANINLGIDIYAWENANGANLAAYNLNNGWNQQWAFVYEKVENGVIYWTIRNPETGKVIDVADGAHNGSNVHLWQYHGGGNQLWTIELAENGFVYIRSKLGDYYLEIDGDDLAYNGLNIQIWGKTGGTDQKWAIWDATINCYTQWTANKYTITYDANGGTNVPANQTFTYDAGNTFTDKQPVKVGYKFVGWRKNGTPNPGQDWVVGESYYSGDKIPNVDYSFTVYAQWVPNGYQVKFNGNGSTSGEDTAEGYVYGEQKALNENNFSKIGYTYANWNTKADGSGKGYTNEEKVINLSTGGTNYTPPFNYNNSAFYKNGNPDLSFNCRVIDTNLDTGLAYSITFNSSASGGNGFYIENQLFTSDFQTLSGKTVVVSFKVRANRDMTIYSAGLEGLHIQSIDLNTSWQTFTFVGTADSNWANVSHALIFYGASSAGTINIGDISISTPSDINLYAQWSENAYAIEYSSNAKYEDGTDKNEISSVSNIKYTNSTMKYPFANNTLFPQKLVDIIKAGESTTITKDNKTVYSVNKDDIYYLDANSTGTPYTFVGWSIYPDATINNGKPVYKADTAIDINTVFEDILEQTPDSQIPYTNNSGT